LRALPHPSQKARRMGRRWLLPLKMMPGPPAQLSDFAYEEVGAVRINPWGPIIPKQAVVAAWNSWSPPASARNTPAGSKDRLRNRGRHRAAKRRDQDSERQARAWHLSAGTGQSRTSSGLELAP